MFTRMTEIKVLNNDSFEAMFASAANMEWEIVKNKTIREAEEITVLKSKFGVIDGEFWVIKSIFGYDMAVSYRPKTNCVQFKIIDPDFGSMMCVPSRTITPSSDDWSFKLSVSKDDNSDSLVYHVQMLNDSDNYELFSKYVVLSSIE